MSSILGFDEVYEMKKKEGKVWRKDINQTRLKIGIHNNYEDWNPN